MSYGRDYQCTLEQFRKDTAGHQMTVLLNQGTHRHLRFRNPACIAYWFDLITAPGVLLITGDCGDFAFRRLNDMFEFFRTGVRDAGLSINRGYWAEKCTSVDRNGLTEFDAELLWGGLVYQLRNNGYSDRLAKFADLKELIRDSRAYGYGEAQCFERLSNFNGWPEMCDLPTYRRNTFHYEWCLWAIVWGISQYDASKPA